MFAYRSASIIKSINPDRNGKGRGKRKIVTHIDVTISHLDGSTFNATSGCECGSSDKRTIHTSNTIEGR